MQFNPAIPPASNIPQAYKALYAPILPTFRVRLAEHLPYQTKLIKTAILHRMLSREDAAARLESLISSMMEESDCPKDASTLYLFYFNRSKKKIDKEKQKVDKGKGLLRKWVEESQGMRDSDDWDDLLKVVNLTLKSDEFGTILFGVITPEHRQQAAWLPSKSGQILPTALALPRQWRDTPAGEEAGKRWVMENILIPLNETLGRVWAELGLGPSYPRPPLVPILSKRRRLALALENAQNQQNQQTQQNQTQQQ